MFVFHDKMTDTTLLLNFKVWGVVCLVTSMITCYRVMSSSHPAFMTNVRRDQRTFTALEMVLEDKFFYDTTVLIFHTAILIDMTMTYELFKEFSHPNDNVRGVRRILVRQILFWNTSLCLSAMFWSSSFFIYGATDVWYSMFWATLTVVFAILKSYTSWSVGLKYINVLSVPIVITSVLNWLLTLEAALT